MMEPLGVPCYFWYLDAHPNHPIIELEQVVCFVLPVFPPTVITGGVAVAPDVLC